MNFHQTTEEIINAATAEQRILWNYLFLQFGEKIGLQQLYFCGSSAGSEFLIYSANKIYFAFTLFSLYSSPALGNASSIVLFDKNNAVEGYCAKNIAVWNATEAVVKYVANPNKINNIIFSRISGAFEILFIGYRVSI